MGDEERLAKIEQTLIEIRERLTRVETKLDSNNGKKNGNWDLRTWVTVIVLAVGGGGSASYGLQSAFQSPQQPQIQYIQTPIDYSVRPNGQR